jgi:hypothetical protein
MITPLQAVLLLALAAYVLGRRRTRGAAGVALVGVSSGLIVLLELSGLPWRVWAEGAVFGAAGWLAYYEPGWLLAHRGFANELAETDRTVRQELLRAEQDWRSGRIGDVEYSRAFDRTNLRFRALQPPPGEWKDIIDERIRIREEWSRIFANPSSSSQAERDKLGEDEKALRKRIARAS